MLLCLLTESVAMRIPTDEEFLKMFGINTVGELNRFLMRREKQTKTKYKNFDAFEEDYEKAEKFLIKLQIGMPIYRCITTSSTPDNLLSFGLRWSLRLGKAQCYYAQYAKKPNATRYKLYGKIDSLSHIDVLRTIIANIAYGFTESEVVLKREVPMTVKWEFVDLNRKPTPEEEKGESTGISEFKQWAS